MSKNRKGLFLLALFVILFSTSWAPASGRGVVIMAKKVQGDIPLDPDDSIWREAEPLSVALFSQLMTRPRVYKNQINSLEVRALHNSKEIAFLLQWRDDTQDVVLDVDRFPDAAAVEFPSSTAQGKPHFGMGDAENPANIWYWKSIWQLPQAQPMPPKKIRKEYSPRFVTDEKTHIFVDEAWLSGVLALNPVSTPHLSPVENLVAAGFGSLTQNRASNGQPEGKASWSDGMWRLILKRKLVSHNPYDARFHEGEVTPVAFAIWNGSEMNRGSRKALSTWYYVALETEETVYTYVLPIVVLFIVAVAELLIIRAIRRKRTTG
jgi:hypothetical protein